LRGFLGVCRGGGRPARGGLPVLAPPRTPCGSCARRGHPHRRAGARLPTCTGFVRWLC